MGFNVTDIRVRISRIKRKIDISTISFLSHAKNYLAGDFFLKAVGFITIPIFTRLLSQEDFGILAVYNSFLSICIVLIGLNMSGSIVLYYNEKKKDYDSFLYSIYISTIVLGLIELFCVYFFRNSLSKILNIPQSVIIYATIAALVQIPYMFYITDLQTKQKSKKYVVINITQTISIILVSVLFVLFLKDNKYLGKIYSQLLIGILFFVLVSFNTLYRKRAAFKLKHTKYALYIGIPLIPHTLSGLINQFFDKIMINSTLNSESAGLYSVAVSVAIITRIVSMSMNKAWIPVFYKNMSNKDYDQIAITSKIYYRIYVVIAICLLFFHKELFYLLVDKKFKDAIYIIPILILSNAYGPLYSLYGLFSFYDKKTVMVSISTFISAFLNILLNIIFIPKYGYIAAAYTTLISLIVNFIFHYIVATFILNYRIIKISKLIPYNVFAVVSTGIVLYLNVQEISYLQDFIFRIFLCLFILLLLYLFTKVEKWIL